MFRDDISGWGRDDCSTRWMIYPEAEVFIHKFSYSLNWWLKPRPLVKFILYCTHTRTNNFKSYRPCSNFFFFFIIKKKHAVPLMSKKKLNERYFFTLEWSEEMPMLFSYEHTYDLRRHSAPPPPHLLNQIPRFHLLTPKIGCFLGWPKNKIFNKNA